MIHALNEVEIDSVEVYFLEEPKSTEEENQEKDSLSYHPKTKNGSWRGEREN